MKKLAPFLVLVLLLSATAIVSADPPSGVGPSVRIDPDHGCGVHFDDGTWYEGIGRTQYSNGATGHSTYNCKLEFVRGTPKHVVRKLSTDECDYTVSVAGKQGTWTKRCFKDWSP